VTAMKNRVSSEERRKYPRRAITLVLEYWETYSSRYGGLAGNMSETGLLIYSVQDMPIGRELNVTVFFSDGYELDGFSVFAKVVWKDLHCEGNWKGHKYGLEFVQISPHDQRKLVRVLNNHSPLESPWRYLLKRFKTHECSTSDRPFGAVD